MIALFATLLLLAPATVTEPVAAARLTELRLRFPTRPKAASVADLERLANEAAGTPSAARALVWLGDISLQAKEGTAARAFYARAAATSASGTIHCFALRGLGDVALAEHDYRQADRDYAAATAGAPAILGAELVQKRALAARLLRRQHIDRLAWLILAGALLFFLARLRPLSELPRRLPSELLFVAPLYALLIVGALGRDRNVLHALELCALGSLVLIGTSALAAHKATRTPARIGHLLVLVAANLALFYVVLHGAVLLDTLKSTLGGAVDL